MLYQKKVIQMKNKHISHSCREVNIYKAYYKPSFNPGRFIKSVLGVLIFGSGPVANHYVPVKKRKP
jgi:hypothetical protein